MKPYLIEKMLELIHQDKVQMVLILLVVYSALLLDNLLGLVIIPLIPNYLREFELQEGGSHTSNRSVYHEITFGNRSVAYYKVNDKLHSNNIDFKNPRAGILFASKSAVQVLVGPLAGTITDKVGYEKPMLVGLLIIFASTMTFAFGQTFALLVTARSIQGIGSVICAMAGFSILAQKFNKPGERSKFQGIAIAIISSGCFIAPPCGGLLHKYVGKQAPFIILAVLALLDFFIMLFVRHSKVSDSDVEEKKQKTTPIYRLKLDSHVVVCTAALFVGSLSFGILDAIIGSWMKESMDADEFQRGIVWLPSILAHFLGVAIVIQLTKRCPQFQWLCIIIGLLIEGLSSLFIGFCRYFILVMFPLATLSLGLALVESNLFPLLAQFVDMRYPAGNYGSAYAIAVYMSIALSYTIGPFVGDVLYQYVGFSWVNVITCFCSVLCSPLLLIVRKSNERLKEYEKIRGGSDQR